MISEIDYAVVKSNSTYDIENDIQMKELSNTSERSQEIEISKDEELKDEVVIPQKKLNQIVLQETFKKLKNKRKYGRMTCFLFCNGDPLIAIGPDWGMYLLLTGILFLAFYSIFVVYSGKIYPLYKIIGIALYLIQCSSYTLAAFANPGIPASRYYDEVIANPNLIDVKFSLCSMCQSLVNMDNSDMTYHCSDCGICIEGFDHHCPWTTKCIGKKNLFSFYVFVTSTFVYIFYFLVSLFAFKHD